MGEDSGGRPLTPSAYGACEPVTSMALEPPRYAGLLPSSTPIRLVCSPRLRGRRPSGIIGRREAVVQTIVKRAAGLDVHKAQVTACVRVPDRGGGRVQEVAEFQTTVRGLLALCDWLKAHRVTQVAMEATGVYWKPVWAVLEEEFDLGLTRFR